MTEEIQAAETQAENPDLVLTRKINKLAAQVRAYYARGAKEAGSIDPSRGQGRVLALLAMKPETTQKDLQFLLDMKQQSLSELLSKLEAKGYIEREKSEDDGRITVVRLTEVGAKAAPDTSQKPDEQSAFDCLGDEERAQFEKSIDAISASLQERLGDVEEDYGKADGRDKKKEGKKRHRYGRMGKGRAGKGAKSMAVGTGTVSNIAAQVLKEAEILAASSEGSRGGNRGGGRGRGGQGGRGRRW